MGSKRELLVGVVACLTLAGCGGGNHTTSTPPTAASTPTTASTSIASRLLTSDELKGFTRSHPSVETSVSAWVADQQTPSKQVASETKRLAHLGFVAGASEDLSGPGGHPGVSMVEQFKAAGAARSELANEVKVFKAKADGPKEFTVTGIPGALGLAATGAGGINVAFTSGNYYYLVGAFFPAVSASSKATVVAAARRLNRRVHG